MNETPFTDIADWMVLHQEIRSLASARAANERAMCQALLRAHRDGGWRQLGLATFIEYAERFASLTRRQTEDRLRVAVALERLPATDAALMSGELPFTAVRELCRIATPKTEAQWLSDVEGLTVSDIEKLVSGRALGDLPGDPPRPRRHRLSFSVSAEVFALFREARAKVRADIGGPVTDEEVVRTMARMVLGGPENGGQSAYQVAVSVCPACRSATQNGAGEAIPIDKTATETALCDFQQVDEKRHAKQDIPPATRRLVMRRQHDCCAVPGCRLTRYLHVHHIQLESEGGTHDETNLLGLCDLHHAAVHRGAMWIEGTWSSGLRFSHADGSVYGSTDFPASATLLGEVYQMLIGLGIKEREARARVAAIRSQVGAMSSPETAFRLALAIGLWPAKLPHGLSGPRSPRRKRRRRVLSESRQGRAR